MRTPIVRALFGFALIVSSAIGARAAESLASPQLAAPPPFTTIYRFLGAANADWPRGGVALDINGNVYGTTLYDGTCSNLPYCGVAYTLTKPAAGKTVWTDKILHNFGQSLSDGISPIGPVVFRDGVLYGTTSAGANPSCGCGEVFKLTKSGAGWTYTILHRFNRTQGTTPNTGLLFASNGTMYGTTIQGGTKQDGVIYSLTPAGGFTVLHDFIGTDGATPQGELIFGKDGAIYGTAFGGGKYNQGVVFRITTGGSYSVLYNFLGVNQPGNSHDGADPEGRLALGSDGTIYGTTTFGGTPSGYGTAWSLTPPAAGKTVWGYKQIYIFGRNYLEPNLPHAGVVRDGAGNLYGVGAGGGNYGGGVLYKLAPPKSGSAWTLTSLHVFIPRNPGGDTPYADLALVSGVLYGTTLVGGIINSNCNNGCGTVWTYKAF